jgi:hypothetical protein
MTRTLARALLTAALACTVTGRAYAQARPGWEWFAGYAVARESRDAVTLPVGWDVAIARTMAANWLLAVADASGSYKSEPVFGGTLRLRSHALLGGVRVRARIGPLIEFGQVLGGVVHNRGSVFGVVNSETHPAVQPGVGLDYPMGRGVAIRGEIDARFTSVEHEWRFGVGVVIR